MIQTIVDKFYALLNYVKRYLKIDNKYKVQRKDLLKSLVKQFPTAQYIDVTDNQPLLMKDTDVEKLLMFNLGRFKEYVSEEYDCENFAYVLRGMVSYAYGGHAFGTVKVKTGLRTSHMLNCYINEFQQFKFVEPQTNKIFSPGDMPGYEIVHVII